MFPAARFGDPVSHDKIVPSGVIGPPVGPPQVLVEGLPAACLGDLTTCGGVAAAGVIHPPQVGPPPAPIPSAPILTGSAKVLIGNRPLARWSVDTTACGAFVGDEKLLATRRVFVG